MAEREQKFIETIKDDFSEKEFIDALMLMVNNFCFNPDEVVEEILNLDDGKQNKFEDAMASCVYAMENTDAIDGRNECASKLCKQIDLKNNPMPSVRNYFLRQHPTLQQSAIGLFCDYIDKKELYPDKLNDLRNVYGDEWYLMPMI